MGQSKKNHCLTILRNIIGLTQVEMAELAGVSKSAIQSIELGRLKLSETLALIFTMETGCDMGWLQNNDVTVPPFDHLRAPYTRDRFYEQQAKIRQKTTRPDDEKYKETVLTQQQSNLTMLVEKAYKVRKLPLYSYKISDAFDRLNKALDKDLEALKEAKKARAPRKK